MHGGAFKPFAMPSSVDGGSNVAFGSDGTAAGAATPHIMRVSREGTPGLAAVNSETWAARTERADNTADEASTPRGKSTAQSVTKSPLPRRILVTEVTHGAVQVFEASFAEQGLAELMLTA